ncbi:MAG: DUF971 family protein [Planctomycetota bacterium]|jgi:DUF971 family protein
MMTSSQTPTRIRTREDSSRVSVEWEDGATSVYTATQLRRLCPCAQCINEMTGKAILDPTTVAEDMTHTDVQLVGQYAITIRFADGHSTGIFTFAFLRENDPEAA